MTIPCSYTLMEWRIKNNVNQSRQYQIISTLNFPNNKMKLIKLISTKIEGAVRPETEKKIVSAGSYNYLTIKRNRNSLSDKGNGKTVIVSYTTLNHISKKKESFHNSCMQYMVKLSRIHIGHIRLNHGQLISRNNQ